MWYKNYGTIWKTILRYLAWHHGMELTQHFDSIRITTG